jgi:uncharacterized protein (UPF0332 family)
MNYKEPNYSDLLDNKSLKKEKSIGFDQINRLISRAIIDIEKAEKQLNDDLPTAMDLAYKSMFHASNALIRSQGYRPGSFQQHRGVVEAIRRSLGDEAKIVIKKFDKLRKARNEFEYQAIFDSSKTEIRSEIKTAKELVRLVRIYIEKKNPQQKLLK